MRATRCLLVLGAIPSVLHGQATKQAGAPAEIPAAAQQIAAVVLALPTEYRAGAKVLGYKAGTKGLVTLREGTGPFTCLASDPAGKGFHAASTISRSNPSWLADVSSARRAHRMNGSTRCASPK